MHYVISEKIQSDNELKSRVERAKDALSEVIQSSIALSVTAKWDSIVERDSQRIWLTLTDELGASAEVEFPVRELHDDARMVNKFHKVWGDLLQRRSHMQLNQLLGQN